MEVIRFVVLMEVRLARTALVSDAKEDPLGRFGTHPPPVSDW